MPFIIDESGFPLVRTKVPAHFSDPEWNDYFVRTRAFVLRKMPYGFVNDTRGAQTPNAKQRGLLTESYKTDALALSQYLKAAAMVVDSSIMRGALTAMFWVQRPPFPLRIFTDIDTADAWVRRELGVG